MLLRRFYSDLAHKYSKTLHLPTTKFPKRSSYRKCIDELIPKTSQELYKQQFAERCTTNDIFIFHDGPPYANGELHLGHALNKILKDLIIRFNLIKGKKVFYKPGWDCHGLPIELKALETLNKKLAKDPSTVLSIKEIRQIARNHATKTIQRQLDTFKQFAILTDFEDVYITMDHKYEINQLKIFKIFLEKGLITRQRKPVFWGCETHTALAEGELEYNDTHNSVAAYLQFPINTPSEKLKETLSKHGVTSVSALIWTSTPWTIAANRAIAINRKIDYTIITDSHTNLIVSHDLADGLADLNSSFRKLQDVSIPGEYLEGSLYTNPISKESAFPILHGDHVTNTAGTGLVHTAPGHGNDDYFLGLEHGIEVFSPVNDYGKYTKDVPVGFEKLVGKKVLAEGTKIMLELLQESGMVFKIDKNYIHSYPYDWRSKKPIIIRATPQWFANVGVIKEFALKSLDDVNFYPSRGKNRLTTFIKNRNEWCISRQRSWGVPIPALYSKEDDTQVLLDKESLTHIIGKLDELGTDAWFEEEANVERWLPETHRGDGQLYYKGKDTMDVWFDSGTSWSVINEFVQSNGLDREYLADVYLEGSDQHRGWFQSSLLTKIGSSENLHDSKAPYKNIITHGFTLDEKGKKMSKSLGNILTPDSIIEGKNGLPAIGVDGLRLWAAQADYTTDITIGPTVLKQVGDTLKKLRITMSFLLGNLNGFKKSDSVSYESLKPLDRYALSKLAKVSNEVFANYEEFNFSRGIKLLSFHLNNELSSTYFDITKDRLYAERFDSVSRRSAQTVLAEIFQSYISMISPVLPILSQESWDYVEPWVKGGFESPFLKGWHKLDQCYLNPEIELEFEKIWQIKSEVLLLIEKGRKDDKTIRNSLETQVYLNVANNTKLYEILQNHSADIADYFLVSELKINETVPQEAEYKYSNVSHVDTTPIEVTIIPSSHEKCPRCWKYTSPSEEIPCGRCEEVLKK